MRGPILIPLAALLAAAAPASVAVASHRTDRVTPESTAPVRFTLIDTVTGQGSAGSTGPFAASGFVCPSGTFEDTESPVAIATKHTCGDGSGVFDSLHHSSTGAQAWDFTGGTGRYTTLRGRGQCQLSQGTNTVRTCQFLAAFDDVAPSATVTRFTVAAATRRHAYTVHTSFAAHDDVAGNAVVFKLSIRAGTTTLARKTGTTTGAAKSFVLAVKPPKVARELALVLALTDPVGNTRTVRRTKRLPHSRR